MSINGIGAGYPAWRENADFLTAGRTQRNGSEMGFAGRMANMVGTNALENGRKTSAVSGCDKYVGGDADQESKTQTDIIVMPDGSRVLVVTMSIGGMETTTSLEISKPTEAPNENSEHDTDNNMPSGDSGMDAGNIENSSV